MENSPNETRVILAIQALKKDPKLSQRAAAAAYKVPRSTLRDRLSGHCARRDSLPATRLLTDLEEKTIIKYVLDQDSKGQPFRFSGVEDMANRLLEARGERRVGVRWVKNFIQRHPEISTRRTRRYDYQRAQCEDLEVVRGWFKLVQNVVAKYGIVEADIYNFDETGFAMGIISTTTVVTSSDKQRRAKMKQPGNRNWVTVIECINSAGWAIPPYIIVKGKVHQKSWFEDAQLPAQWRINTSPNGWTNNEIGLDWLRHFDKYSEARKVGAYRLLVLDRHESHQSVNFELYCKENNIITLCMPAHSSHLLQPLDVGCFGPLKKAYGKEIENLVRTAITHISKDDFFPAFHVAHNTAMSEGNIQGAFRGAGLIPFDPEHVISRLDIKLKTPTPPNSRPGTARSWTSKTPDNPTEAQSQFTLLRRSITNHLDSSPTKSLDVLESFQKGTLAVMHEVAILREEVRQLRATNETISRRRRVKKTRLRAEGSLSVQEAVDLQSQIDVDAQVEREIRVGGGRAARTETRARRCGNCGETGHNVRTCEKDEETSGEEDSE